MTPTLWLRDLWAYSVQVAVLVAAAALLAWLLRIRASKPALVYWQLLLAACLALPLLQTWQRPRPARGALTAPLAERARTSAHAAPAPSVGLRAERAVVAVIGMGIALRAGWLLLGVWSLGRMRRRAVALAPDLEPFREARQRLGVAAEFYASVAVTTPITFGFRRPAVLLPKAVLALDREAQRAIAYHELVHVARRDWGFLVVEECARGLLWFHPAIWWLVGRIHLTREEVVDRAVVELTEARDCYVDALLAVASFATRVRFVPATLFLRKSLLRRRVAELFEETIMSKRRLTFSLLAVGALLLAVGSGAARMFPLEARAAEGGPVQVQRGGDNLLHRAPLDYPARALRKGVEGDVQLSVDVDERGEVADARVLSGPQELRAAALESVLHWHYASGTPASREVVIHFQLPEERAERGAEWKGEGYAIARTADGATAMKRRASLKDVEQLLKERQAQLQAGNLSSEDEARLKHQLEEATRMLEKMRSFDGPLGGIRTERVSEEAVKSILGSLNLHVGDPITSDTAGRILEAVRAYDEHFRAGFERDADGRLVLIIIAP